ncbi:MAG: hypothetical protein JWN77_464 [Frankiales bacterium]|nr:hypothetical protein [Frankiales bacterium]
MTHTPLEPEPPSYAELLELQRGVIARRQALPAGLTREAWQWRIGRDWQSPLPGIAVAHVGTLTFEEKVQAAVLYGGDGAAVSGDALVYLTKPHGDEPATIDVAVDARCQIAPCGFFRPHRCSRLDELRHPVRLPTQVRIAPAVLHAAAWAATDRAGEWRLAASVQKRLVTVPRLRDGLLLLPRLPRRRLIRHVLDDVELGAHAQTELDLLAFLRRHGLPLPDRLQYEVRANGKRYLDAWWERPRVAAEVDGAHHVEVGQWDRDTLRANAVVVANRHDRVLLLRVTAGNLRHDEAELVGQFRSALAA